MTRFGPKALGLLASTGQLDLTGASASDRSVTVVTAAVLQYEAGLGLGPREAEVLRQFGLSVCVRHGRSDHLLHHQVEPFRGWRDLGRCSGDTSVDVARAAVGSWVSHQRRGLGVSTTELGEKVAHGAAGVRLLCLQLEALEAGRDWSSRMPSAIAALGLDPSVVVRFGDAIGGVARALALTPEPGAVTPFGEPDATTRARLMQEWLGRLDEAPRAHSDGEGSATADGADAASSHVALLGESKVASEGSTSTAYEEVPRGPRGKASLGALRAAAGFTQVRVAEVLGVASAVQVAAWETGRMPVPADVVVPLAELLGVGRGVIEALVEVGDRSSSAASGASGPRGETPLGALRAAAGYSQARVATALGLSSPAQVSIWETGRAGVPDRLIEPLARLYGVPPDEVRARLGDAGGTFGELEDFRHLEEVRVSGVELSTRLRNALTRLGVERFGDLRHMGIDEFREVRNVGGLTVDELVGLLDGSRQVTWLKRAAPARRARRGRSPDATWSGGGFVPAPWEDVDLDGLADQDLGSPAPATVNAMMDDLAEVAAWWAARDPETKLLRVLHIEDGLGVPASVMEALARLREVTAEELAGPERLSAYDPVRRFEREFADFDERTRDILVRRAGRDAETLDSVGAVHGVTRERVRQLAARGQRAVDAVLRADPDVAGRLAELRESVSPIVNDELLDGLLGVTFPRLQGCAAGDADVFRSSVERLVGDLRVWREGWSAPAGLLPVLIDAREGRLDDHPLESLQVKLSHTDRSAVDLPVLLGLLELEEVDGRLRRRSVGLPARAVAELEDQGRPLVFDVLVDRLGPEVNVRTLRNALLGDERIVRTDRDVFALAVWGHETYDSIPNLIARHLRSNDGAATIQELIRDLTGRFSVAASSVRAYARSHRFVALPDGRIRERRDDDPIDQDLRPLRECAGCARIDGRWAYRVRLDEQLLAGYSAPVPESFAAHLGVQPLERRSLVTGLGTEITVTRRGLTPFVGMLRPVAERLQLAPGSLLFVVAPPDHDGEVSFVGFNADRVEAADGLERVGLELGLRGPAAANDLASALDLEDDADLGRVVSSLRARGEVELADAVGATRNGTERTATTDDLARLLGL